MSKIITELLVCDLCGRRNMQELGSWIVFKPEYNSVNIESQERHICPKCADAIKIEIDLNSAIEK